MVEVVLSQSWVLVEVPVHSVFVTGVVGVVEMAETAEVVEVQLEMQEPQQEICSAAGWKNFHLKVVVETVPLVLCCRHRYWHQY